jgi:hypothetical protein
MLGSYVRRTPFSRSAAMTANRACPPYATAHHERRFDGNKRVSIEKPLIMCGFADGRPFQAAENWPCFAFSHSTTRRAKGVATTRAKGNQGTLNKTHPVLNQEKTARAGNILPEIPVLQNEPEHTDLTALNSTPDATKISTEPKQLAGADRLVRSRSRISAWT